MSSRFLSTAAAARAVGIGRARLRRMTIAGLVPAYDPEGTGRRLYDVDEVAEAVRAQTWTYSSVAEAKRRYEAWLKKEFS